jgi:hypothetical protein
MHGIGTVLLDARRALGSAVAAYLVGKKRRMRESTRMKAIASADAVMTEWETSHPNVRFR